MTKDQYRAEVIDPGDRASRLAHRICQRSFRNSKAIEVISSRVGGFRGPDRFVWKKHILSAMMAGKIREFPQNDGAGGKPQFFTLLNDKNTFGYLGWEIIAMNADDIARWGGFPVVMMNEMQVQRVTEQNFPLFRAIMAGYGQALRKTRIVNLTGEFAVMKTSITAFCDTKSDNQLVLTWGGTCIGLIGEDQLIDGSKIEPEMPIVGFWERGYRCNGGGFFTDLILYRFGSDPKFLCRNEEVQKLTTKLTVPSTCYAPTITRIVGWNPDGTLCQPLAKVVGIAHITGGGIWSKLGGILPLGIGAHLGNMPNPPAILLQGQIMSQNTPHEKTDWQCYSTFHGGCGMLVVIKTATDAQKVIAEARKDGIAASIVGKTRKSAKQAIIIESRFMHRGKTLSSNHPE